MEKMGENGKKVYDKRGKYCFYFKNRKSPIFLMTRRNLDLGMGKNVKNGQKSNGKRRKNIRFKIY